MIAKITMTSSKIFIVLLEFFSERRRNLHESDDSF